MRRRSPSYLPFPQKARLNGYEGDGDNCGVSFCRVVESSAHIAARKDKWHICAYYAILPLKKEIYDLLKKGRITDLDISSDSLDDFTSHQHVALYVVEIVVDKKDESCSIAANVIVRDMIWYVDKLVADNHNIFEVAALIATDHGAQLAKKMGFRPVKNIKTVPINGFFVL